MPLLWANGPGGEPRRMLGLIARGAGKLEQAIGHFSDSLEICRNANYPIELAWTYCEYADALRQRGGTADLENAEVFLREGRNIA